MTIEKEAEPVKDNLGRLLRPGVGIYFVVMAMFCAFTLLAGNYWLAIAESCVTMLVFAVYLFNRKRRDRKIQRYLAQAENTLESIGRGECPFPAVLVRLADGGIVWTNSRFSRLTGIADTMMEHELEEVLPETAPLPEEEPAPPSVLQPDSRDKVKASDRVMAPKRFKFMWSNSLPFRTAGPGNFIIA